MPHVTGGQEHRHVNENRYLRRLGSGATPLAQPRALGERVEREEACTFRRWYGPRRQRRRPAAALQMCKQSLPQMCNNLYRGTVPLPEYTV